MKVADQERVIRCQRYVKLEHRKGHIYMKEELFLIKQKKILKCFKDEEWHLKYVSYNEWFMNWVAIKYKMLKRKTARMKEAGYKLVFLYPRGHEFKEINDERD